MSSALKTLVALFLAPILFAIYQNCAPNAPRSPASDRETKLTSDSGLDFTDEALMSDLSQKVLSTADPGRISEIRDAVAKKVLECRHLVGSQRNDCIWELVIYYFEILNQMGFDVSAGDSCLLATKKASSLTVSLEVICYLELKTSEEIKLSLDECRDQDGVRSAWQAFRSGRAFHHINIEKFRFSSAGTKALRAFRGPPGATFHDKCLAVSQGIFLEPTHTLQVE